MRQLSESGKQRLKEIEAKDKQIEEYEELLKKYLDIKPEDYRSLAEDAQNWQAQRHGEIPKDRIEAMLQKYQAQSFVERIERAINDNDHLFFRKLAHALEALKSNPEGIPIKPKLPGQIILAAEYLHKRRKKPTAAMIRAQIEAMTGRRISDRSWSRWQKLAYQAARLFA